MKTNQILKSNIDRSLYGITIRQHTKDEFFSITDLQTSYDRARVQECWQTKKEVRKILNNKGTQERIFYILRERGIIKGGFLPFMEMIENEGVIKYLKKAGLYKQSGRGANKHTACDVDIWVLLALELNPAIYAKVITWLSDGLIQGRVEGGDSFVKLNKSTKIHYIKRNKVDPPQSIFIDQAKFIKESIDIQDWNLAPSKAQELRINIHKTLILAHDRCLPKVERENLVRWEVDKMAVSTNRHLAKAF